MLAILFLCRIIALFTFITPDNKNFVNGDKIILPIVFFFMCLLFSLPVIPIVNNGGMQACADQISKKYSAVISVFYFCVFIWTAGINASRFSLFIGSVMFGNENRLLMLFVFLFACTFAAVKGIEPTGRTASMLLFLLIASLFFVGINAYGNFDKADIIPPFYNGTSPVLAVAFHSVTRTLEAAALMFMCDKVNGKFLLSSLGGLAMFSVTACIFFLLIAGVTGAFGDTQLFQLYTLTTVSGFGKIERLDTIIIGFWTLCAFIKTAFFIFLAVNTVENSFSFKANGLFYGCSAAAVFIITLLTSASSSVFSNIISSPFYEGIFVFSVSIIPTVTVLLNKIKNHKRKLNT